MGQALDHVDYDVLDRAKEAFIAENLQGLIKTIEVIAGVFRNRGKLLVFGNGGSAADAQHIAAEFVNRFEIPERPALPAIALTTDSSILTSISNDTSFDHIFSRQVEALGTRGDVALAISTSGSSPNILNGIKTCRRLGIQTIAMTGGDGGEASRTADLVLNVGASCTAARIQETHITIGHILCEMVETELFRSQ